MTYTRITVPQTAAVLPHTHIRCDEPDRRTEKETEAATVLPKEREQAAVSLPVVPKSEGRRHFSVGLPLRLLIGMVSCFAAFVTGCSLGDSELCRVFVTLGAASGGALTSQPFETSQTYYHVLADSGQTAPAAPPAMEIQAETVTPSMMDDEPIADAAAEQAGTNAGGAVYADGETLYPIDGRDLSAASVTSLGNQTGYTPDTSALLAGTPASLRDLHITDGEPLVLIVHTHGTECYHEGASPDYYSAGDAVRCTDTEKNVVGIGSELTDVLTAFNIPVLHDTRMCDEESFVKAYSVSAQEVQNALRTHPSIRFVIDLHRDAIEGADGMRIKPVYDNAGAPTAQLMFVVGTDASGNAHPGWQENLALALHLREAAAERFPKLFRSINLRQASFNQQYSSGYMLLECGSCSNTYDEAKRAVRQFGEVLARVILENAEA